MARLQECCLVREVTCRPPFPADGAASESVPSVHDSAPPSSPVDNLHLSSQLVGETDDLAVSHIPSPSFEITPSPSPSVVWAEETPPCFAGVEHSVHPPLCKSLLNPRRAVPQGRSVPPTELSTSHAGRPRGHRTGASWLHAKASPGGGLSPKVRGAERKNRKGPDRLGCAGSTSLQAGH